MAGIQEVSAILGIAEIGLRSISALYNFVRDLKDTSTEIQRVRRETEALQRCLRELCELRVSCDARAAIARIGLQQSVHDCRKVCAKLHRDLLKWTGPAGNSTHRTTVKVRVWVHKKDIEKAIGDIALTKQTAILSILVAQLSIQLGRSATAGTHTEMVGEARAEIKTVARKMKSRNSTSTELVQRSQMAVTQVETTSPNMDSSKSDAEIHPGVGKAGLGRASEPGQSTAALGGSGAEPWSQEWQENKFKDASEVTGIQEPPSTASVRQVWKSNEFEGSGKAKIIGISSYGNQR